MKKKTLIFFRRISSDPQMTKASSLYSTHLRVRLIYILRSSAVFLLAHHQHLQWNYTPRGAIQPTNPTLLHIYQNTVRYRPRRLSSLHIPHTYWSDSRVTHNTHTQPHIKKCNYIVCTAMVIIDLGQCGNSILRTISFQKNDNPSQLPCKSFIIDFIYSQLYICREFFTMTPNHFHRRCWCNRLRESK